MPVSKATFLSLLQLLRPHQWCKNGLLFLPLVFAHRITEWALLEKTFWAAACFSLMASGVYVLNDYLDVAADRLHPQKKYRPLASGKIPLGWAPLLSKVLMGISLLASTVILPFLFSVLLIVYLLANVFYSKFLKKIPVVDVFVLTLMFILRILSGGVAGGIPVSLWLLGFSLFFFLSIAFAKRVQELSLAEKSAQKNERNVRGYHPGDLHRISRLGMVSGLLSVVVLTLYVTVGERQVPYRSPEFLWFLSPLMLLWTGRFWRKTLTGKMLHDPVLFALKDPVSYVILFSMLLAVQLAYII